MEEVEELPLIRRCLSGGELAYEVAAPGLAYLRTLATKRVPSSITSSALSSTLHEAPSPSDPSLPLFCVAPSPSPPPCPPTPPSQSSPAPHNSQMIELSSSSTPTSRREHNREIKFRAGYAKSPYFLALLPRDTTPLRDHFRYREGAEGHNRAVDVLIDFFPERNSVSAEEDPGKLGEEF
ncbi:unnamed protein product [Sphagnum balticum]